MLSQKRKSSSVLPILDPSNNQIPQRTSNKPLWISEVKKSLESFFPAPLDQAYFEQINELISQDNQKNTYNQDEFPYYSTIKKIMYSFGDTNNSNHSTIIHMHNFITQFIYNFSKLIKECEFKKIIEHFFSYEYEKLHNYQKLKFKNNIIIGEDSNLNDNDLLDDNNDYFKKGKESAMNNINFSEGDEKNLAMLINCDDKNDLSEAGFQLDTNNLISSNKNYYYTENTLFQSERTEKMDNKQYYEYFSCRQHNFLSNGKKEFSAFLEKIIPSEFPSELKDISNIKLLAYILKEEIRKIITDAIKSKHPNKKLFVLTQPLTVEDIAQFCDRENENLTLFLNDYYSDIFLIKEFKKRSIVEKSSNRNVKVKKSEGGKITIIVKKFAFIPDEEEAEYLKNIKKISEQQVINAILMLKDKYIQVRKERMKNKNSVCGCKKESFNSESSGEKSKGNRMTIADWVHFLGIDNYYEYFLIKEYLKDIDFDNVKQSEFLIRISVLNKINKKKLSNKFGVWLQMDTQEKVAIKNEFENIKNITKQKPQFN